MKNSILNLAFNYAVASHKGNYKPYNEDAYHLCAESQIWVVADGMGGHEGGDIASKMAAEHIVKHVKNKISLIHAIDRAHKSICLLAETPQGKSKMGTTVVATQIIDNQFNIAWVGDSRAYLFDNQELQLLSQDHTLVQELINKAEITEAQAKIHPKRNIINQALGGPSIAPDEISGTIGDGILLLCTDGLNNELNDSKIKKILLNDDSLQSKADLLINSVLALTGSDNITVLLIQRNVQFTSTISQ